MTNAEKTIELLQALAKSKKNLSDTLVAKGEEASFDEPFDDLVQKAADYIPKSYILVDESGKEMVATLVEQETVFDADENDVRAGKVFATSTGVKTGTKEIPAYHTSEGYRVITSGSAFVIPLAKDDKYNFTKLQALLCPYNTSMSDSVAAQYVCIEGKVYAANSTESICEVLRDSENKEINLQITNESDIPYILRYFTYKEIY